MGVVCGRCKSPLRDLLANHNPQSCVSASPSTSARPVAKSETPAGSSTASNMASSPTAICPPTKPSGTTPSRPSSLRLELASMSQEQSSSIWSLPSSMRPDAEPTVNCTILSNSSTERRTPLTTTPEDTTPSERRLSTWFSTGLGSSLTPVLDFRDSFCSIPSEVALDPALRPCSWRGFPWTTARRASSSSPSTLLPGCHCCGRALQRHPDHPHHPGALRLRL